MAFSYGPLIFNYCFKILLLQFWLLLMLLNAAAAAAAAPAATPCCCCCHLLPPAAVAHAPAPAAASAAVPCCSPLLLLLLLSCTSWTFCVLQLFQHQQSLFLEMQHLTLSIVAWYLACIQCCSTIITIPLFSVQDVNEAILCIVWGRRKFIINLR